MIRAGDSQRLPGLLGIDAHKEIHVMGRGLVFLADHSLNHLGQGLQDIGLGGGGLAHVDLLGQVAHGVGIVDFLGIDAQVDSLLGGQQEVELLHTVIPALIVWKKSRLVMSVSFIT